MKENCKILVVEDDPNLGQILQEYLGIKGYEAELATNGVDGLNAFKADPYDLCLLDIMMPKKDGFELAEEIREIDKSVPIIFLTAKSMKDDAIRGLKIGADDYITKPFSMEELLLRIKAVLKRSLPDSDPSQREYQLGSLTFLYDQLLLRNGSGDIKLTSKEADLLWLLCENQNELLDRSLALKRIWKDDSYFNARSMDVYIAKLRKHLQNEPSIKILTIHGQGFKLVKVD